jgi:hypothetical protein
MSFLEKKIKENAGFFNDREIPEGHRQRFLEKLDKTIQAEEKPNRIFFMLKIAATVIVLVMVSVVFFSKNSLKTYITNFGETMILEVIKIEFSDELENVFAFYDSKTKNEIDKIEELAINEEEATKIRLLAEKQLQNIDAEMAAIEKEFMTNPGNKQLEAALINHKRQKAEIMETILNQLNAVANINQTNSLTN